MEEEYKQYKTRLAKTNALSFDIVGIWALTILLLILANQGIVSLPGFECSIPYLEPYPPADDPDSLKDTIVTLCKQDFLIHMGGYLLLLYVLLAAVCIASPLKATPVQYISRKIFSYGTYFANEKDEQPKLYEAIRLMMVSRHLFPWYLLFLYFIFHDFEVTMYSGGGAIMTTAALLIGLKIYDRLVRPELSWDERFSGLRVHLTQKTKESIDEQAENLKKRRYRFYFKIEKFGAKSQIFSLLGFTFFALIAFNFIRDGAPPAEYDQVVYQRPAPVWTDNAFFALAGLDAPTEVDDFYEYGRQRILFHAERWANYNKRIPVPYVHDVPQTQYNLFKPYEPIEKIEFDDNGIDDWDCLYDPLFDKNNSDCPSIDSVLSLSQSNELLWKRFLKLADYEIFSIPDTYLMDATYSGQNLITLTDLLTVHLIDLQARGYSDKAIELWIKFAGIYKKMVHNHDTMVSKAIFMVAFGIHYKALESLLYNNPQIAVTHGDAIKRTISLDGIIDFQAGQMFVDDWRLIGVTFLPTAGMSSHYKRELLSCFKENQLLAELSAKEYFNREQIKICEKEFPHDFGKLMLESFTEPGFFITNMIYNLVIGGVLKGHELMGSMHRHIANIQMVNAGMELIRRKVAPQDVQAALNNMPEDMQNPIAEEPFLWDEENGWIYYPNPEDPMLQPSRVFRVNLRDNAQ